jgi:hypothetical protein
MAVLCEHFYKIVFLLSGDPWLVFMESIIKAYQKALLQLDLYVESPLQGSNHFQRVPISVFSNLFLKGIGMMILILFHYELKLAIKMIIGNISRLTLKGILEGKCFKTIGNMPKHKNLLNLCIVATVI